MHDDLLRLARLRNFSVKLQHDPQAAKNEHEDDADRDDDPVAFEEPPVLLLVGRVLVTHDFS